MNKIILSSQTAAITSQIIEALRLKDNKLVLSLISNISAEDIAEILETTPPEKRNKLWDKLPSKVQGKIIGHLNTEVKLTLLQRLNNQEITKIAKDLETDEITDLVQSLNEEIKQFLLQSLKLKERQAVDKSLKYPQDTAGGLMNTDVVTVRNDVTIEVVLRYLRKLDSIPEHTTNLYVQSRKGNYKGTILLTQILTNNETTSINDLVDTSQPAIKAYTPANEVAHLFEKYDLISAIVVDDNNLILGHITIDDVVDIIREEAEHVQMVSAGLYEDDDLFAPPMKSAKRRSFWLGVNLITAIIASMVISLFDTTIEEIVALAVLMPIIASMGGIAGTQTSTIVIRAMATGKLTYYNSKILLLKELMVGVFNGITWSIITGLTVAVIYNDIFLSIVFGVAIMTNLIVASSAGAIIPLVLKKLKIDPVLASGLLLTTVTDILGFLVFLGLATIVLLN